MPASSHACNLILISTFAYRLSPARMMLAVTLLNTIASRRRNGEAHWQDRASIACDCVLERKRRSDAVAIRYGQRDSTQNGITYDAYKDVTSILISLKFVFILRRYGTPTSYKVSF